MAGNTPFGLISLILTAGACVMIFFIILAGAENHTPLNQIYYLWADTSKISGAPPISEWTLWNVCTSSSMTGGGNTMMCGKVKPANPFLPQQNFGTSTGVPDYFLSHHRTFYYLSRVTFAFYLISLFFMVSSLATGLLALCSRLGSAISSLTAAWACFCLTVTAALMTSFVVLGRNHFRSAGISSGIGIKNMAFTWASVACLFIASALYCLGFVSARRNHGRSSRVETKEHRGGVPFFRRRRSPVDSERAFA